MQKIGTVKMVQIQLNPLKEGVEPNRVYSPEPIRTVDKLQLTPEGIIGITATGEEIMDVHHAHHPRSRNNGANSISLGFMQHYKAMQQRFGKHITNGVAGESILIDAEVDLPAFGQGKRHFIQHDDQMIELLNIASAAPCRPFSEFCLQVAQCQDDIKAALQFLSDGVRGYYALVTASDTPYYVQAGDGLYRTD